MFRNYISLLLFIALFGAGSVLVSAQTVVGGKVELKGSGGDKTAVMGAKVDCYRLDVKENCGSVTTDKTGKFALPALPSKAKIVLAISGKGLAPQVVPNVRIDNTNGFVAEEGDGSVPAEEQVRLTAYAYMKGKGTLTKAQKDARAELEKKNAEIEAKNANIESKNADRTKYMEAGNKAFKNKDLDAAITNYDAGYKVDPEYLGSAPVFLNKKVSVLKKRAVNTYNAAVKTKDKAQINAAKVKVVKDFSEALDGSSKAYEMMTNAKPEQIENKEKTKKTIEDTTSLVKEIFRLMGLMNLNLALNLITEKDATNAVNIYQRSLKMVPDNPDVLAGLAMALYSSSEFKGSKAEKKESLVYWNRYKKVAPKTHSQQATADGMIEFLKEEVK